MTSPTPRQTQTRLLLSGAFAGVAAAIGFLAVLKGGFFGVVLGFLTPLPLFYTAMSAGTPGIAAAAAAGFLLVALQAPAIVSIGMFLICYAGAPALLAWQMERTTGFGSNAFLPGRFIGRLLAICAGVGGLLLAIGFLHVDGRLVEQGGFIVVLKSALTAFVDQMAARQDMANDQTIEMKAAVSELGVMLIVGVGGYWLVTMALNAGIAARLLTRSGKLRGASLAGVRMPQWVLYPLVAASIASFSYGAPGVAAGIAAVALMSAAAVQGMSVVHMISHGWPARTFVLGSIYALCFFYSPAGLVLALIGIVDTRVDLRDRILKPD